MRQLQGDGSVDLWVVTDVTHPGVAVQRVACMQGSMIGTCEFFTSGGARRAVVGYLPCMHMQKSIFISPAFSAANWGARRHPAALAGVASVQVADYRQSCIVAPSPDASSRYGQVPGLGDTGREKRSASVDEAQDFTTLDLFLSHILRIDHGRTALGIGESA